MRFLCEIRVQSALTKMQEIKKPESFQKQTAIDVTGKDPDHTIAGVPEVLEQTLPERQQSYRVRDRNSNNYTLGFLLYTTFFKMLFLILQLSVIIKTWDEQNCNNLPVIHMIIFILTLVPVHRIVKWHLCVIFVICVTWTAILMWVQYEWANNHSSCNQMLSTWTLVILIGFLYFPLFLLFVVITGMLIDSCQEALQIPRAIAALKHYLAPDKKGSENECCICQVEYQNNDQLTQLPCSHEFHTNCIEPWIRDHPHNSCPICRASLL